MKKSKVLIPAMALLVFSTAASISSTVAWFSATRVFQLQAGDFKVAQLDGNLECDIAAGVGTTKEDDNTIFVGHDGNDDGDYEDANDATNLLLDASFEHVTNKYAYRLNRDEGNKYQSFGAANDALAPSGWQYRVEDGTPDTRYYVAVTWTMTFKYDFADETRDVGIFLDINAEKSYFTRRTGGDNEAVGANGLDAAKGMRICFTPNNNGVTKIWGNHTPDALNAYSSTQTYVVDAEVTYAGQAYKCTTEVASAEAFDSEKWTAIGKSTLHDEYSATKTYAANDIVVYQGATYKAKAAIDPAEAWNADHWDAFADNADLRYVTSATATKAYSTSNYIYTQTYARATDSTDTDGDTALAARKDFIGKILYKNRASGDAATKNLVVTCTAWFEGEDPNVVNNTAKAAVGANMTFYARSFSTAEA